MLTRRPLLLFAATAALFLLASGCHKKGRVDSGGGQAPPAPAPSVSPTPPASGTQTLGIYNDAGGVLGDPNVLLFTGGGLQISEESGGAPEGNHYLHATQALPGAFWGVTFDKNNAGLSRDLSSYSAGGLRFWIRVSRTIAGTEKIDINLTDKAGHTQSIRLTTAVGFDPSKSGTWQDVSIPISAYDQVTLNTVKVPFAIAIASPAGTADVAIDIDNIRWELPYQDLGGSDSGIIHD